MIYLALIVSESFRIDSVETKNSAPKSNIFPRIYKKKKCTHLSLPFSSSPSMYCVPDKYKAPELSAGQIETSFLLHPSEFSVVKQSASRRK